MLAGRPLSVSTCLAKNIYARRGLVGPRACAGDGGAWDGFRQFPPLIGEYMNSAVEFPLESFF